MKVVKQFYSFSNFRHFRIAQNTSWMSICKVLHKHKFCLQFNFSATDIQEKVIENKGHAKLWATNKVDYGRRKNGEWAAIKFIEQERGSLLSTERLIAHVLNR